MGPNLFLHKTRKSIGFYCEFTKWKLVVIIQKSFTFLVDKITARSRNNADIDSMNSKLTNSFFVTKKYFHH